MSEQAQKAQARAQYRAARELALKMVDEIEAAGLTSYHARLEVVFLVAIQAVGISGLAELKKALMNEPVDMSQGPRHETFSSFYGAGANGRG